MMDGVVRFAFLGAIDAGLAIAALFVALSLDALPAADAGVERLVLAANCKGGVNDPGINVRVKCTR